MRESSFFTSVIKFKNILKSYFLSLYRCGNLGKVEQRNICMYFVFVEGLEGKTVSQHFSLLIVLLLPRLDMCGCPCNLGQKNIHLPGTK